MKKRYGENWQKLLGTHIHFTIYIRTKVSYVVPVQDSRLKSFAWIPLKAFFMHLNSNKGLVVHAQGT